MSAQVHFTPSRDVAQMRTFLPPIRGGREHAQHNGQLAPSFAQVCASAAQVTCAPQSVGNREALKYARELLAEQCPDAVLCGALRADEGACRVLFRVPSWGADYRGELLVWVEPSGSLYGEW